MKTLSIVKWLRGEGFRRWLNPLKLLKRVNFESSLNSLKVRARKWLNREYAQRWLNPFKFSREENYPKPLNPLKFRVPKWLKRDNFCRWLTALKRIINPENFRKLLNPLKIDISGWLKRGKTVDEMALQFNRYYSRAVTCRHVRVCYIEPQHAEDMRKYCKEVKGVETAEFVDEEKKELIVKGCFELHDLRLRLLSKIYGGATINRVIRVERIAPNMTHSFYMVNLRLIEFERAPRPTGPYTPPKRNCWWLI